MWSRPTESKRSVDSSESTVDQPRAQQSQSTKTGQTNLTSSRAEQQFGTEINSRRELNELQRLAKTHGRQQVRQWIDEGIPREAMGDPGEMRAFRETTESAVSHETAHRTDSSVQRMTNGDDSADYDDAETTTFPVAENDISAADETDDAEFVDAASSDERSSEYLEQYTQPVDGTPTRVDASNTPVGCPFSTNEQNQLLSTETHPESGTQQATSGHASQSNTNIGEITTAPVSSSDTIVSPESTTVDRATHEMMATIRAIDAESDNLVEELVTRETNVSYIDRLLIDTHTHSQQIDELLSAVRSNSTELHIEESGELRFKNTRFPMDYGTTSLGTDFSSRLAQQKSRRIQAIKPRVQAAQTVQHGRANSAEERPTTMIRGDDRDCQVSLEKAQKHAADQGIELKRDERSGRLLGKGRRERKFIPLLMMLNIKRPPEDSLKFSTRGKKAKLKPEYPPESRKEQSARDKAISAGNKEAFARGEMNESTGVRKLFKERVMFWNNQKKIENEQKRAEREHKEQRAQLVDIAAKTKAQNARDEANIIRDEANTTRDPSELREAKQAERVAEKAEQAERKRTPQSMAGKVERAKQKVAELETKLTEIERRQQSLNPNRSIYELNAAIRQPDGPTGIAKALKKIPFIKEYERSSYRSNEAKYMVKYAQTAKKLETNSAYTVAKNTAETNRTPGQQAELRAGTEQLADLQYKIDHNREKQALLDEDPTKIKKELTAAIADVRHPYGPDTTPKYLRWLPGVGDKRRMKAVETDNTVAGKVLYSNFTGGKEITRAARRTRAAQRLLGGGLFGVSGPL